MQLVAPIAEWEAELLAIRLSSCGISSQVGFRRQSFCLLLMIQLKTFLFDKAWLTQVSLNHPFVVLREDDAAGELTISSTLTLHAFVRHSCMVLTQCLLQFVLCLLTSCISLQVSVVPELHVSDQCFLFVISQMFILSLLRQWFLPVKGFSSRLPRSTPHEGSLGFFSFPL